MSDIQKTETLISALAGINPITVQEHIRDKGINMTMVVQSVAQELNGFDKESCFLAGVYCGWVMNMLLREVGGNEEENERLSGDQSNRH